MFTVTSAVGQEQTSLDQAVRQLAERAAAIPNVHGPLRLQFLQDPAFEAQTGKDWHEAFRDEFEKRHLTFTDDPNATLLRVGVAETPAQLVLSAAATISDKEEVRFLTFPRATLHLAALPVVPVRIERQLVYQSPERILDASSLWNGADTGLALLAYHNRALSILRVDSSGQLAQVVSLASVASQPSRDPRGELIIRANEGVIFLPAKTCEFSWTASSDVKCHASKPTWRESTVLTPSCGAGGWKLLADGSDWSAPDVLRVVPDNSSRQSSAALFSDFSGPILNINGEQNPASALVVTKNIQTGNYEVYKIILACGN